ncbi:MAG TPA: SET domain-containing protein-lysine N-methyltransferase [Baekduia sp.]|nr:SET domain-containing protein-lysine N-methyltransferase [Baekduia sp.]
MQTLTIAAPVYVGQGPIGRGVFAARAIEAKETIEICPLLEVPDGDATGVLRDYVVNSNYDTSSSILMLGYGMLYNHAERPNAEYVERGREEFEFIALRRIEAGEEITISYGSEWWETRELTAIDAANA